MSNSIAVTGNLTREPEVRYTREGRASTLVGVAVNRRWENRETREWEETTSYFDVVCWRDLAENAALTLAKGMRVMVIGRLEQRSWETEDGERRSKVEIVADEIGPSLRFATAEVQRNERRSPGGPPEAGGSGAIGGNGHVGSGVVGATGDDGNGDGDGGGGTGGGDDEAAGDGSDGGAGDGGDGEAASAGTVGNGTGITDGAGGGGAAGDAAPTGAAAGRRTRRASEAAPVDA